MGDSEHTLSEINTRLAKIELRLEQLVQAQSIKQFVLDETEKHVVATLAAKPLKAAALAIRMGVGHNSDFRSMLYVLKRVGVLGTCPDGYFVIDGRESVQVKVDLGDRHYHGAPDQPSITASTHD